MSKAFIEQYPLLVLPDLAGAVGLHNSIVLQQIKFLTSDGRGNLRDGKIWVYNTIDAWHKHYFYFWSKKTVERIFKRLEDDNLILSTSKYNAMPIDRTKWYSVNYKECEKRVDESDKKRTPFPTKGRNGHDKLTEAITIEY